MDHVVGLTSFLGHSYPAFVACKDKENNSFEQSPFTTGTVKYKGLWIDNSFVPSLAKEGGGGASMLLVVDSPLANNMEYLLEQSSCSSHAQIGGMPAEVLIDLSPLLWVARIPVIRQLVLGNKIPEDSCTAIRE